MRLISVGLVFGLLSAVLCADVVRPDDDLDSVDAESSEITITAHFPDTNPFHHVVNGESNSLFLIIDNKSAINTTLKSISGSFHHPVTDALVKNLTAMSIPVLSIAGSKFSIPFAFHSELKPGDYGFYVWVDHTSEGVGLQRTIAYEGKITVVEPKTSLFDIKMIITYLITTAALAAAGYYAVLSFFPSLVKPKRRRVIKESISAPSTTVTTSSGATYQEEWIPEHHLKPAGRRGGKKANAEGALSSGDEKSPSSGGEEGAATSRKSRRGKKA